MSDPPALDVLHPSLAAAWASQGLTVDDLEVVAADQTLRADRGVVSESGRPMASPETANQEFERVGELGRGGMGVVYLATQASLRREVAIKCLAKPTARGVSGLLKEAWVAGALDHPNVVPVYTVVRENGAPTLVMKRVEGVSWAALIQDPERRPGPRRGDDEWSQHVEIFRQVCNAVQFAHSRGVVHLDLKPENVMVGAFGEVYVVDWGLSAGIEEHPDWLMPATNINRVAGTPVYMAPELAAADGPRIGRATDIYLLGATLHEALTGEPLHAAATLVGLLTCAILSEPYSYGSQVHPELAALLNRACHVDPEQRFDSVDALREALEEHLRHGESNRLADEAQECLELLRSLPADAATLPTTETRCRLLLEQASRRWPQSPQAREIQSQLLHETLYKALERGDLALAEQLATQQNKADSELEERLAALRDQRAAEQERVGQLSVLEDELDVGRALTERRRLFFALGLVWLVVNLALGYLDRSRVWPIGYRELIGEGVIVACFFAAYFFVQRDIFFQNVVNARIQRLLVLTGITTELLFVGGFLAGVPVGTVLWLSPLLYSFGFAAVAAAVDGRLLIGACFQLVAFVGIGLLPEYRFEILGVSGLLSAATTWRWPAPEAGPEHTRDPAG